eukprot:5275345-Pyramimonas_sp.AAC.1
MSTSEWTRARRVAQWPCGCTSPGRRPKCRRVTSKTGAHITWPRTNGFNWKIVVSSRTNLPCA